MVGIAKAAQAVVEDSGRPQLILLLALEQPFKAGQSSDLQDNGPQWCEWL